MARLSVRASAGLTPGVFRCVDLFSHPVEIIVMSVSKIIALSLVAGVLALAGCRTEEPYKPLKLGADINVQQQAETR
jgi:hypothetical protein